MRPYGARKSRQNNPNVQGLIESEELDEQKGLKKRARQSAKKEIEEQMNHSNDATRRTGDATPS